MLSHFFFEKIMRPLNKVFVFNSNGSTKERWFVYWYTVVDGKRKRKRDYGYINQLKGEVERTRALLELQQQTQFLLNSGVYDVQRNFNTLITSQLTIGELITRVIKEKAAYLTKTSESSHRSHLNYFLNYLTRRGLIKLAPQMIKQRIILDFRSRLLANGVSNRTVNNIMIDVKAMFTYIYEKDETYNHKNPCVGVLKLRTRSETHVRYSQQEAEKIRDWLKTHDPMMHLFCQFIAYTFLRPNEIRQLKINQFDLQAWTITREASDHKTGKRKIQILQEVFRERVLSLELHKLPGRYYLFGKTGSRQSLYNKNIRPNYHTFNSGYFTRRFKKCKLALGFSEKHTMYGLKHTFICHLKQNGATDQELMNVTGIETIEVLHKYLREIGATEVRDLSEFYSFEF